MIKITQGDLVTLTLYCPNHSLTGATLTTLLKKKDGTDLTLANAVHTKDPDQVANPGKFTLALTAAETVQLILGHSTIITKVDQTTTIRYFHGVDMLFVRKATHGA